jgi:hypothetical protein
MVRFLFLLVNMLTVSRRGRIRGATRRPSDPYRRADPCDGAEERDDDDTWIVPPEPDAAADPGWRPRPPRPPEPAWPPRPPEPAWPPRPAWPPQPPLRSRRGRRRVPLKLKWAAILILVGLIFRKVIAWAVIAALSAALHLVGLNVHLPHVKLSWPWQSISAGTTTNTDVGPWVLQKIEGISRPALGTENFNFTFTHKVSKNIGIWPCWYQATFAAAGHASATVDLNPGPSWWTPGSGHYQLKVLSRPAADGPGRVSVAITLPPPQLPQSVHDVTVDDTMSHPIDVQHSWTYPGLGCGALIQPQFSMSVLYGLAQNLAFTQATHNPRITRPLISAAEAEAAQIIRNNFVQPTVNALGYTLTGFTVQWSAAP